MSISWMSYVHFINDYVQECSINVTKQLSKNIWVLFKPLHLEWMKALILLGPIKKQHLGQYVLSGAPRAKKKIRMAFWTGPWTGPAGVWGKSGKYAWTLLVKRRSEKYKSFQCQRITLIILSFTAYFILLSAQSIDLLNICPPPHTVISMGWIFRRFRERRIFNRWLLRSSLDAAAAGYYHVK